MDEYLNGSEYDGTLSPLTRYGTLNVSAAITSGKRERGKVRGNKRKPRSSVIAVTSCKVYANADDYNNGIVARTIESARTRTDAKHKAKVANEGVAIEMTDERAAILAALEAQRSRTSFDQSHREQY